MLPPIDDPYWQQDNPTTPPPNLPAPSKAGKGTWNEGTVLKDLNRLTVVETIYHQRGEKRPNYVEARYDFELGSTEQAYQRELEVGPNWQKLDMGWVKNWSILHIKNEEGARIRKLLNKTQQAVEQDNHTIEVGIKLANEDEDGEYQPLWVIPPSQDCRLQPFDPSLLYIRCRNGKADCTVTLFPG